MTQSSPPSGGLMASIAQSPYQPTKWRLSVCHEFFNEIIPRHQSSMKTYSSNAWESHCERTAEAETQTCESHGDINPSLFCNRPATEHIVNDVVDFHLRFRS